MTGWASGIEAETEAMRRVLYGGKSESAVFGAPAESGHHTRCFYDDPNVLTLARSFGIPTRLITGSSWPRFVLFPRLARLHRRLR